VEHTTSVLLHYKGHRGRPGNEAANGLIDAMKGLYYKLWHGCIGQSRHKVPVAGDTTRLPHANNLSPLQKKLAWNMHFLAQHLPGVQQIRQIMGHSMFGARVNYGDTLFFTLSPNPQHSALVLRLFRGRQNDPFLQHPETVDRVLRANSTMDRPSLEETIADSQADVESGREGIASRPSRCSTHFDMEDPHCVRCAAFTTWRRAKRKLEETAVELPLPPYEVRRVAEGRDPMAVMDAFSVHVRLRLPAILGVRMCPNCPRCNDTDFPCQNRFGNNMRPMGGSLGGGRIIEKKMGTRRSVHLIDTVTFISPMLINTAPYTT